MEATVAQKLDFLLQLQAIDSQLDEIKKIRGDLPEEVRDLEDDIIGLETRIKRHKDTIDTLDSEIHGYRQAKRDAEKLIVKYKDQQNNVRNNREFDAINKEIEFQELEMKLADKRTAEASEKVRLKEEEIRSTQAALEERKKDLDAKRKELDVILDESQEDEKKLIDQRDKQADKVEERLRIAYQRIRDNSSNGLAVVTVRRAACSGCFNVVPPQRQADIREKKKLIICEHCGRILADVEDAPVTVATTSRR